MATYVMSDIHGCYDKMMEMLQKIEFSPSDKLIIAGDYVDRGLQIYETLNWIMNPPENVVLLRGNHDEEFAYCVDLIGQMFDRNDLSPESAEDTKLVYELLRALSGANKDNVFFFDYYGTFRDLIYKYDVTMIQLDEWADKIREMPLLYRETIGERDCIVVHAGYVESLEGLEFEGHYDSIEDFYTFARDDAYVYGGIPHGMIVAGHTPTIWEDGIPYNDGDVYRAYDEEMDCIFYDVDCGLVYKREGNNAKLACLRLEDEVIFYV